jgi:hypothetical protein
MKPRILIGFLLIVLLSFLLFYNLKHNHGDSLETFTSSSQEEYDESNAAAPEIQYDNYNHFQGTSTPTLFYGPNGATARVLPTANDNTLVITNVSGTTDIYYIDKDKNAYVHPDKPGVQAKVVTNSKGQKIVVITYPDERKIVFYSKPTPYMNSVDSSLNAAATSDTVGGDYSTVFTGSSSSSSSSNGIPRNQIPPGQEDMYILKSEIVPPICPACPAPICPDKKENDIKNCPACPPCARCPEPNFECKKVPSYMTMAASEMPMPMVNGYSTFGM